MRIPRAFCAASSEASNDVGRIEKWISRKLCRLGYVAIVTRSRKRATTVISVTQDEYNIS